jgi:hypothetical protein
LFWLRSPFFSTIFCQSPCLWWGVPRVDLSTEFLLREDQSSEPLDIDLLRVLSLLFAEN